MHQIISNKPDSDGDTEPVSVSPIKVVWDEVQFERMYAAARKALPNEIGGLGLVTQRPDGVLYIYETILLPQRVAPASTDLDKQGMADWMAANPEKVADCKVWWHSHANFGVFLSGTDQACITELLRIMPWLITPVVNVRNDLHLQLHLKEPVRQSFDVEYDVESAITRANRECEIEVPENIIKEVSVGKYEPAPAFWETQKGNEEWRKRRDALFAGKVPEADGDLQPADLWEDIRDTSGGWGDRVMDGTSAFEDRPV